MASQESEESLRSSFVKLQKTVSDKITRVQAYIHYGASTPPNIEDLRLWITNKFGRTFIKYKISDTPSYMDIKSFHVVQSELETSFITNRNYGTVTASAPMYGMRLKASTINSETITVGIPANISTQWLNSAERLIDESLSYFKNTVTGKVITFSSMYHKGLEEVSIEDDSVVFTFATGSSLSDWECVFCINYVG